MGTYLKSLSIAGYRSYNNNLKQNTIDLKRINIIIGANGAGKSNLISFLEMVSYMMTRGLRNYVSKQGGAQSLMHFGPKETEQIRGELQIHDSIDEKEDIYSFALEQSATNQLFFANEKMQYQDRRHFDPFVRDFGVGHLESGMPDYSDSTIRILRNYLEQLRVFHFNDTSISSRIRSSTNITDSAYLRSDGGNIAAFLYRMREDPDTVKYYDRIVRYVRIIMPQFLDFFFAPDQNGVLSLNWRQDNSEEVFGPHQFSDGTLRFIALTTLLLQPPKSAPMTIILDEPEIGLHPYAISVLAKEIRTASNTSQIIVSTQSPLLLNEFECEDIIIAEYDEDSHCTALHRPKKSKLAEWLKEYSLGELWQKNVLGGLPV